MCAHANVTIQIDAEIPGSSDRLRGCAADTLLDMMNEFDVASSERLLYIAAKGTLSEDTVRWFLRQTGNTSVSYCS